MLIHEHWIGQSAACHSKRRVPPVFHSSNSRAKTAWGGLQGVEPVDMFFPTVLTALFLLARVTANSHRHQHLHAHEKRGALCTETHIYYEVVYETVFGTPTGEQQVIDTLVPSTVLTCPAPPTVTLTWTPPVMPIEKSVVDDRLSIGGPGGEPGNYDSQTTTLDGVPTTTTAAPIQASGDRQVMPVVVTTSSAGAADINPQNIDPKANSTTTSSSQYIPPNAQKNDPNAVPNGLTTTIPTTTTAIQTGGGAWVPTTITTSIATAEQVPGNGSTVIPSPGAPPPAAIPGQFGTPQTPGSAEACAAACNAVAPGAFPGTPYPRTPDVCAVKGTECSKGTPCISQHSLGAPGMSYHQYTKNPTGDYCGYPIDTEKEYHIVAVGLPHMGGVSNHGTGRPKDANCGRKIRISVFAGTPQAAESYAYVVDRCSFCEHGLDVSEELFKELTKNTGLGRVDVSWYFED